MVIFQHKWSRASAFGMDQEFGIRMMSAEHLNALRRHTRMYSAITRPEMDFPTGFLADEASEILIRNEKDFLLLRDGFDHLHRIGGGAAVIALRFDLSRRVD